MTSPTSPSAPFRVAIIGAGPAAFYAADALLRQDEAPVEVDMFDRLCSPYGLVRHGVAPDHLKIKNVTRVFEKTASDPRFRFFGNVEFGTDITLDDVKRHYHQVLYATGAQTDRTLGIPGEDLQGSHPATEFVAWYNGHPDFRDCHFDLSQRAVAIVGVGNVALDVARILCLTPHELRASDMAPHAVEALSKSRVREVHLLGRRGPAQAAFTNPEVKELADLEDVDIVVDPAEAELDAASSEDLGASGDRTIERKVEMIREYSSREPAGRSHRLHLRFLVSPTEILDDGSGRVGGLRLVRNRLSRTETGSIVSTATGETEALDVGLVFRSVGYRGVPLPGVPFHEAWGVIPNDHGRVIEPESGDPVPGLYASGWIKRGPFGVIGTNKPDAVETVTAMLEDLQQPGRRFDPALPLREHVDALLAERSCSPVSFEEWSRIDAMELERGEASGRPRVKFTSTEEMLAALHG